MKCLGHKFFFMISLLMPWEDLSPCKLAENFNFCKMFSHSKRERKNSTLIWPASFRKGPTYDDLASSKMCVTRLTPGLSSCLLIPDRSAQRFCQNSISSRGPEFSAVSNAFCELSTSLICRAQWMTHAEKLTERQKKRKFSITNYIVESNFSL